MQVLRLLTLNAVSKFFFLSTIQTHKVKVALVRTFHSTIGFCNRTQMLSENRVLQDCMQFHISSSNILRNSNG